MTATKKQRVPALRFPEFTGEWEEKNLGELLSFKNGINAPKEDYGVGIKFINVLDILNNDYIIYENIIGSLNVEKDIIENYSVNYGDILFQRSSETRGEVGSANVYLDNKQAVFGGFVIRGKKIGDFNPIFMNKLLKTAYARDSITSKSGGSTRYNVGQDILSSVDLPFPSLPEQQKIADFLSSLDERIRLLKEKKKNLEAYKKGVMQQIFSQSFRFKDENGNDYPDWEEKRGSEIFESISNKNHNSDLPILAISQEYGAIPRDLIDYRVSVSDDSINAYKVVDIGDFIISLRSFQGGIEYSKYKGICSPAYIILRPFIEIDNNFFKHYFKTYNYIQQLNQKLEGIRDGKMVSYKYFSEIFLPYPSLDEQQQIADFLSAIDNKIVLCSNQIKESENYKKGLLQQMFVY